MRYIAMLFMVACVFALSAGFVTAQEAQNEEMSCEEIMAQKGELRKEYKSGKHAERKAFEKWDKYYKEIHSMTYGGTDRPLADTVKSCDEGDGPNELFCKEAKKRYNELASKEAEAKKELDATKQQAEEKGGQMRVLGAKAESQGCTK